MPLSDPESIKKIIRHRCRFFSHPTDHPQCSFSSSFAKILENQSFRLHWGRPPWPAPAPRPPLGSGPTYFPSKSCIICLEDGHGPTIDLITPRSSLVDIDPLPSWGDNGSYYYEVGKLLVALKIQSKIIYNLCICTLLTDWWTGEFTRVDIRKKKERLYLVKLVESLPELGGEKLLHGLGHELHDLGVERVSSLSAWSDQTVETGVRTGGGRQGVTNISIR